VGCPGLEPGIQGFSDRCSGCSWIAVITRGFRTANACCLWSLWVIWMCFVTIKCPNDHRLTVITYDLGRWWPCGIPSVWRSPTTRQPGGSPRRDRRVGRIALPPGWRVVALGGGRGDATPCLLGPTAAALMAGYPGGLPPGEGTVVETDSHETAACRRRLLVVGQRRISLLIVVASAETAPDCPDPEPVHGRRRRWCGADCKSVG
jgi:hypothetical protein